MEIKHLSLTTLHCIFSQITTGKNTTRKIWLLIQTQSKCKSESKCESSAHKFKLGQVSDSDTRSGMIQSIRLSQIRLKWDYINHFNSQHQFTFNLKDVNSTRLLFLCLTSTCFPMLLFPLLNSTEHPDLKCCTSREKGLCPTTMLLSPEPSTRSGPFPEPRE